MSNQVNPIIESTSFKTIRIARLTGVFYLCIIICGLYSGLAVRETLIVPNEPLQTLEQVCQQLSLFKIGFLCDLWMVISDVLVAGLFFILFRARYFVAALFALLFRFLQAAVLGGNLLHLLQPILQIQNASSWNESASLATGNAILASMQNFEYGYLISGVFFAVNCALMGYLLLQSNLFPKLLGYLLLLAALGYIFNCLANFVAPNWVALSEGVMFVTAVVGELLLCLYLLIWGCRSNEVLEVG